jgi:hypothetical protein
MWHVLKTGDVHVGFRFRCLGKVTFGIPRHRRKTNKINIQEADLGDMDWIDLGQR